MRQPETDNELLTRHRRGDRVAFERFYRRHAQRLWPFLQSLLHDADLAQEALQTVFIKVLRHLDTLATLEDAKPYLFQVAWRVAADLLRDQARERKRAADFSTARILQPAAGPADGVVARDEAAQLEKVMLELVPELREVVYLHIYEDMTFPQISEITSVNANTLQSRYQKALALMREKYHAQR